MYGNIPISRLIFRVFRPGFKKGFIVLLLIAALGCVLSIFMPAIFTLMYWWAYLILVLISVLEIIIFKAAFFLGKVVSGERKGN